MNQQQPSALGTTPEACTLTVNHQELTDLRTALADRVKLLFRMDRIIRKAGTVAALLIVFLGLLGSAHAQSIPTIYIDGPEDFSTAITAALHKKHVPVQVTLDGQNADYVLHAAGVSNKTESGGAQVARCLFMDCIGAFGSSSVSVTLVKANSPAILWAYQVRKSVGGPLGTQSLSEAIAKHLKHDYFTEK